MSKQFPVVFVHGFLGWGPDEVKSLPYWGEAERADPLRGTPHAARFASVGPLSSYHDRACELFYQIKGIANCDYGAEHAARFHHQRIVRRAPLARPYLEWDGRRPIHLVTHSQGAQTARMLQHLLAQGNFFRDAHGEVIPTDAGWIRSITAISAPLNGTTLLYHVGCDKSSGLVDPKKIDVLQTALQSLPLFGPLLAATVDYRFDLEQWHGPTCRRLCNLQQALAHRPFIESKDNAFYDLSLHGAFEWNHILNEYADTYYFSYPTCQSFSFAGRSFPKPTMNPLLMAFTYEMGSHSFSSFANLPGVAATRLNKKDWRPNDGIVPTFSQDYPKFPQPHPHKIPPDSASSFDTGIWNAMAHDMSDWDHLDVVMFPDAILPAASPKDGLFSLPLHIKHGFPTSQRERQYQFYTKLYRRLQAL